MAYIINSDTTAKHLSSVAVLPGFHYFSFTLNIFFLFLLYYNINKKIFHDLYGSLLKKMDTLLLFSSLISVRLYIRIC